MKLDSAFDVLSSRDRRRILLDLLEHNPRSERSLLAVTAESGRRPPESSRIEFVHAHLPKLEESGLVRWNRSRREITTGPNFEDIRPLLELLDENEERLPGAWP